MPIAKILARSTRHLAAVAAIVLAWWDLLQRG
jgi:hypothetical protein